MSDFSEILTNSIRLIFSFNTELSDIVFLSLKVSLSALLISCLIGLPIAAYSSVKAFFGKKFFILLVNSLMGLPPVFVGLVLYIVFSKSGPLGFFEILYTPTVMVLAQIILILPIIISISFETLESIYFEYEEMLKSLKVNFRDSILIILWDARYCLLTTVLAGLGRAMSEVGAIIIVGGNIAYYTRVMTTTIALETSKGNLELALALGTILILISISLNFIVFMVKHFTKNLSYD